MLLGSCSCRHPLCPLQHYAAHDQKLRRFVPIIQDSLVCPVVLDSARTVLSLPPVINSAHSAVRNHLRLPWDRM